MERPKIECQPRQREITGELMYLNDMRRLAQFPDCYKDLSDTAMVLYETEAAMHREKGIRPDILSDYERFDHGASETVASCVALADELRALDANTKFIFTDIEVDWPANDVLDRLRQIKAGTLITSEDDQLAIDSNGECYPVLDIKKKDMRLVGVGLCAWGWDVDKSLLMNKDDEPYDYRKHALVFPSEEKLRLRKLEIKFAYEHASVGSVSESITLAVDTIGNASLSSEVYISSYGETGGEVHKFEPLDECDDQDIAAFGDLVAEIVGDAPESASMRVNRTLRELSDEAASSEAKRAIQGLIDVVFPAKASYLLTRILPDGNSICSYLRDEMNVAKGVEMVDGIISAWQKRAQQSVPIPF